MHCCSRRPLLCRRHWLFFLTDRRCICAESIWKMSGSQRREESNGEAILKRHFSWLKFFQIIFSSPCRSRALLAAALSVLCFGCNEWRVKRRTTKEHKVSTSTVRADRREYVECGKWLQSCETFDSLSFFSSINFETLLIQIEMWLNCPHITHSSIRADQQFFSRSEECELFKCNEQ